MEATVDPALSAISRSGQHPHGSPAVGHRSYRRLLANPGHTPAWTVSNGTAASYTTEPRFGEEATKITATGYIYCRNASVVEAVDASRSYVRVYYRVLSLASGTYFTGANIKVYSGNSFSNGATVISPDPTRYGIVGYHVITAAMPAATGNFDPTQLTGAGFEFNAPVGSEVVVDGFEVIAADGAAKPVFYLRLDDGIDDHYQACAYLAYRGFRGTLAVIGSLMGGAGYLTWDQAHQLQELGHYIANHGWNSTNLSSLTAAQALAAGCADFERQRSEMLRRGLRGANTLVLPNGGMNTLPTYRKLLARFDHLSFLNAIDPATQHVDQNGIVLSQPDPGFDRRISSCYKSDTNVTTAAIDTAIAQGHGLFGLVFHALDGTSGRLTFSEFKALVDYLRTKADAGECMVVGLEEWQRGFDPSSAMAAVKQCDGDGSGLDADTVRGDAPFAFGRSSLVTADGSGARTEINDKLSANTAYNGWGPDSDDDVPTFGASTSTSGGDLGVVFQSRYRTQANLHGRYSLRLTSTSNVRLWAGLTDQTGPTMSAAADPAGNYAAFRFDTAAGDTNWQCITKDGTTQGVTDSGVAPTTSNALLEIAHTASSIIFRIDGVVVATRTANLPTAGTNLRCVVFGKSLDATLHQVRIRRLQHQF